MNILKLKNKLIYYFISMNKIFRIFPILGILTGGYVMGTMCLNNIEISKKDQKEISKFIDEKYNNF